jgi:isoleucyl-tRNA synthetase
MSVDYGKTLNLPKTDFPMRGGLPEKEPQILKSWQDKDLYKKRLNRNRLKGKKFVLHDGPPYANGGIHLGTALNKVLKDIIVRYYDMKGYFAPYVPGWDTHGLPTELKAIKEKGLNRHEVGPVVFRQACEEIAMKYLDVQRESFKRLGVMGDWENPYITLKPEFEAKQIEVFGQMAKLGCIYKGMRPVYWCPSCETALAEAEIEYQDDHGTSIYVKFPVKDDKGKLKGIVETLDNLYVVIWTTTTWTLPGNLAISLNPEFVYVVVEANNERYIVAKELAENVMKAAEISDYKVLGEIPGSELEYVVCAHPFLDRDSLVIVGDHVTLEAGSGCVHTAPGHGAEDFDVCKKYPEIGIVVPVDDRGHMTKEAGSFEGLYYKAANKAILKTLKETNLLFAEESITHPYPHCWRCKEPIIYRATEQWFISIDKFRKQALDAIKEVRWIPAWGEERISKMVKFPLKLSNFSYGVVSLLGIHSLLPPPETRMKQGPFPLYGFVVRIFIGTMNPSDSLLAELHFHISAYMHSLYGCPCKVGPLQFQIILSLHTVSHTPEDSSMVPQVLPIFHGLRPILHGSASSCSLFSGFSVTMRQNSLYVTVCTFACLLLHQAIPLSTPHYCDAPGLATRLLGDYRDRTFTG